MTVLCIIGIVLTVLIGWMLYRASGEYCICGARMQHSHRVSYVAGYDDVYKCSCGESRQCYQEWET